MIAAIVLVFAGRVLVDYRSARKQNECKKEEDIQGLLVFSTKPLNLWTQEEVLRWVKIGTMVQDSYFTESKRLLIAEKLAAAAVDGDLLSEQGFCTEKLVKLGGLAWGDAFRLSKEIDLLVKSNGERALVVFKGV